MTPSSSIEKKIIICGIVRNAEKGLRRNIPVINNILSLFTDYKIVIYENNSIDNTKKILQEWQQTNPDKIHTILDDTDSTPTTPSAESVKGINPFYSRKRIDKMAKLRNQYLDYIEKQGWEADYLMVVDLDVAQLYIEGIKDSITKMDGWDIITANGYSTSPRLVRRYHDCYALCEYGLQDVCQTEKMIEDNSYKFSKISDNPIRVFSAFGGLAIYRFEKLKGLRYKVLDNNDSRVEVRCEHYSLSRQIMDRDGHVNVCINPRMILKYQDLTISIVLNSIKRIFSNWLRAM